MLLVIFFYLHAVGFCLLCYLLLLVVLSYIVCCDYFNLCLVFPFLFVICVCYIYAL